MKNSMILDGCNSEILFRAAKDLRTKYNLSAEHIIIEEFEQEYRCTVTKLNTVESLNTETGSVAKSLAAQYRIKFNTAQDKTMFLLKYSG